MTDQSTPLIKWGPHRDRSNHAFSLVEVVIAIAILAFAVIAMLGLMTVALQSTRNADTKASSAAILTTVMGKLTSENFTNTVASLPFTDYFTHEGGETNAASGIYRCSVRDVSPTDVSTNFMRNVQLIICWPAPAYTQTNIVVGSFVKYE